MRDKQEVRDMQKVDETIDEICDWIQKDLKNEGCVEDKYTTAEMVAALAALVSARASIPR